MKTGGKVAIGAGVIAVVGLAVWKLAGQAGATPQPGLGSLYGVVIDSDTGLPISGVAITLDSQSTQTANDGSFSFNNLNPGTYIITFTKAGYTTITE